MRPVIVAGIVGLGMLVVAWAGAADRTEISDQIAWLNLGIVGVLVIVAVDARWVMRGRLAVAERLGAVLLAADAEPAEIATVAATSPGELVCAVGMTRYHRHDCLLVRGKRLSADSRAGHDRAGRQPCEMCRP